MINAKILQLKKQCIVVKPVFFQYQYRRAYRRCQFHRTKQLNAASYIFFCKTKIKDLFLRNKRWVDSNECPDSVPHFPRRPRRDSTETSARPPHPAHQLVAGPLIHAPPCPFFPCLLVFANTPFRKRVRNCSRRAGRGPRRRARAPSAPAAAGARLHRRAARRAAAVAVSGSLGRARRPPGVFR